MKKHVVIVGGGFAGMNVARQLANHPQIVDAVFLSNQQEEAAYWSS